MSFCHNSDISVAIITLNEEDNLEGCLKSVSFSNDIVVVDSDSKDQTKEVARKFGARVINHTWQGFGPQKQFAINLCRNSWVLIVDADERMSDGAIKEISRVIATKRHQAYRLPRHNFFHGRRVRFGSWGGDSVVRLIDKQCCTMSKRPVHESIEVDGSIGSIKSPIHHWPRKNISAFLHKADLYSSLGAQELFASHKNRSLLSSFLHSGWSFFYNYFLRLGVLDGGPGLLIAFSDSIDTFFKYAKCWELTNQNKHKIDC